MQANAEISSASDARSSEQWQRDTPAAEADCNLAAIAGDNAGWMSENRSWKIVACIFSTSCCAQVLE
jgi:hypothetical protein